MDINHINAQPLDLSQSEKDLLCEILDKYVGVVYICDIDTDELLYMNRSARGFAIMDLDLSQNKKCYEVIKGFDKPCAFCPTKSIKNGVAYDTHIKLPHSESIYHITGNKITWRGRNAVVYYVVEEKEDADKLKAKTALYKGLVEDSSTAVVAIEKKNRKILFANSAWCRQEGIDNSVDVVGVSVYDLIEDDKFFFTNEDIEKLPTDKYIQIHKMSSLGVPLNVRTRSISWDGKDAYICYSNDEIEMWSSNRQLQNLVDKIPAGIGIYEIRNGELFHTYLNNAYYRILGFEKEECSKYLGIDSKKAIHPDDVDAMTAIVNEFLSGKNYASGIYRVRNRNSQWVWLRFAGSVVKREDDIVCIYATSSECDSIMKTQQELLSNRAMLDAAMQSVKVMTWIYDFKNRKLMNFSRIKPEYKMPAIIEDIPECVVGSGFVHEDSIEDFYELHNRASKGEKIQKDICICIDDEGGVIWERVIYTPMYDEKNVCSYAIGTSVDITERKEREKRYLKQIKSMSEIDDENLIAKGQHNLIKNEVLFYCGKRKGAISIKEKSTFDEAVILLSKSAVLMEKCEEIKKVLSRQKLLHDLAQDITEGSIEYQRKMPDGKVIWTLLKYTLFVEPDTNDIIIFVYTYDITDRIIYSQILSKLSIMEYEGMGLLDVKTGQYNLKNVITQLEGPAVVGSGDFYERALKRLPKILVSSEKETVLNLYKVENIVKNLEDKEVYFFAYSVYNNEGEIRRKKMQFTYLDNTKDTILYCRSDVTDMYIKEQEQLQKTEKALEKAETASHAKTEFFSRMSHDMRTPMNGILGLATLCEDERDPDVLKENIKKIKNSGDYLLGLINDTLDFQKIESGRLSLEPRIVECNALIESVLSMIKQSALKKNINFTVDLKDINSNWYLRTDPMRIKQIFVNLLSNAVKFTNDGGEVNLCVGCVSREGMISHLLIEISDTGIGMSEEFLKNGIFKPFSQESNEVTSSYAGTGLGLSIVKKLVELMNGTIEVESKRGVGSKFTVCIDIERVKDSEAKQSRNADNKRQSDVVELLKDQKILLCEDHPLNAEIAKKLLEKSGCEVVWAENGEIAYKIISKSKINEFSAVLMDIRMPIMNGIESTKAIRSLERADAKTIPIIAMTANAYEEDVKCSIDAGMNAHLAKPIEPKVLYETLSEYIARGK